MKKIICSILTAALLTAGTVINTGAASVYSNIEGAFADISQASEAQAKAMMTMRIYGVFNGYEDNTFRPNSTITRAEIVKAAYMLKTREYYKGFDVFYGDNSRFNDIDTHHWAYESLDSLVYLGYISGYEDGSFRPNNDVTYDEVIKLLVCMLNYEDEAVKLGGYPAGYIKCAQEIGLTSGVSFESGKAATRGDVAVLFENAMQIPLRLVTSYDVSGKAEYELSDLTLEDMMNY